MKKHWHKSAPERPTCTYSTRFAWIAIPPLTEDRRRQLAKQCSKEGETARISIRNARREGIDTLKKAIKDGLSEDNEKDAEKELQNRHDKQMKKIDTLLAAKEKEIMTV